jgi:hypothetical protein
MPICWARAATVTADPPPVVGGGPLYELARRVTNLTLRPRPEGPRPVSDTGTNCPQLVRVRGRSRGLWGAERRPGWTGGCGELTTRGHVRATPHKLAARFAGGRARRNRNCNRMKERSGAGQQRTRQERAALRFAVVAERVHDLGPVEQSLDLLRGEAVRDVVILKDLLQRPAAAMFADHVLRHPVFITRPRAEERERSSDRIQQAHCGASIDPPQSPSRGHSRLASGIGSPCGSCVGKPSARSMRASSSSEITCSSRSASSCTASTCSPSVFAR